MVLCMEIRKGRIEDIDELAALYDAVNDHLERHVNYAGWKKGVYPVREDAERAVGNGTLFAAVEDGRIVGTFILLNRPEAGYAQADWGNELDYSEIFVLHTFAVHPRYLRTGIGKTLLEYILKYAADMNMKAVRLDVYEKNTPAIRLYEKLGFEYIDTVDLGYGSIYGLDWFRLYQRLIPPAAE